MYEVIEGETHDEEIICCICLDPLLGPLFLDSCEHMFCTRCLRPNGERGGPCPQCRRPWSVDSLRDPPRLVMNMLARVRAKCLTCDTVVLRDSFNKHWEDECPVPCPLQCGEQLARSAMTEHQFSLCVNRQIRCRGTELGCQVVDLSRNTHAHELDCLVLKMAPVLAPLYKEIRMLRERVQELETTQVQGCTLCDAFFLTENNAPGQCKSLSPYLIMHNDPRVVRCAACALLYLRDSPPDVQGDAARPCIVRGHPMHLVGERYRCCGDRIGSAGCRIVHQSRQHTATPLIRLQCANAVCGHVRFELSMPAAKLCLQCGLPAVVAPR